MNQRQRRVAGLDIGSNTTRVLIADVSMDEDGLVTHNRVLVHMWVTRLAQGVDARGILLPDAIARTRNALTEAKQLMRAHNAVFGLAVATSAVRDADNGEAFLGEIEYTYGFRAQEASGDEEAALTFAGVASDASMRALSLETDTVVIDVGGGSTEIIIAQRGNIVHRHSFQLGSVRVTERALNPDGSPPSSEQLASARQWIADELARHLAKSSVPTPASAIAVAGTATTMIAIREQLAVYDRNLVHGSRLDVEDLTAQIERLAQLPLDERRHVVGLHPDRAPVIIGGLLVLEGVLIALGLTEAAVSDADILDGIVLRAGSIAFVEDITELPEAFGRASC